MDGPPELRDMGDSSLPQFKIATLAINTDPESSTFGLSILPFNPQGAVVVVRVGFGSLHTNHLDAVRAYVEQRLGEMRQVKKREAAGKKVDRKEMVTRLMSKEKFKEFFAEMKVAQAKEEPKALEGLECPVE